jgi:transcriptional regulator with XRE-family HTH domain
MVELLEGIGHNIRRLRAEKGWNQTELGFRADTSPSIISLIENAKRNPSTATLAKIAAALGVEVVELFPKAGSSSLEPSFNDVLADERRTAGVEVGETYFVPLEEGEEEDTVTLRIYYVQLFEGGEPILQAMREASPEEAAEAAKMREELEKSGRPRE